ncbi:hypothetical protein [Actinoplanes sichuanensis]|uniref:Uncharacterized protein n=1 Tax=Actinoplanes sichuanensis TaxID=512349 RepID=A0ABW4ABX6_9ACTN|nr:hypothetical protein [Actinoplanes sichuanensis]
MTEPSEPTLPRWLRLAAATAVGIAGVAAVTAVAVRCRPSPVPEPPVAPPPPPPSDARRFVEAFLGALSAEKPNPDQARQPEPVETAPRSEEPDSPRFRAILLAITAAVVCVWVTAVAHNALADPCDRADRQWASSDGARLGHDVVQFEDDDLDDEIDLSSWAMTGCRGY